MSAVNTIRGTIDSSDLGRTLSHEHVVAGAAGMERVPGLFDVEQAVVSSIEALRRAKAAGIDSVIDLTPLDLGRNLEVFQRVADADTGVNVVPATGVYRT
jgi:phosphotriesterase-related protein